MSTSGGGAAAADGERTATRRFHPLTPRQREVLDYIETHIAAHNYPPTGRELSDACGLGGPSGAQRMLRTLERKGYLRRSPGQSRALTLVDPDVDPRDLDNEDLFLMSAMAEGQAVERDCVLAAAARVAHPGVKQALIRDALARHDLVTQVEQVLAKCEEAKPDTFGAMQAVLTGLRSGSSWEAFVVDQIVYNRNIAPVARQLADRVPPLQSIWQRTAELSDRAADTAETWLGAILEGADFGLVEELRVRAQMMIKVGMLTARAIKQGGASRKLPEVAFTSVPTELERAFLEMRP